MSGASSGSLLPAAARATVPWANGKGTTQEVARSTTDPSVGGWRVSIATITDDAAFSDYTGFDRHLMPLTTGGVRLDIAGTEVDLDRYDVLSFDGHDAVAAVGVTSPSLDLNLICGQSYGESSLVAREVSGAQRLAAGERESVVVVVLDGEIRIDGEQLGQYDAWGVPEAGGAEVTGIGRIAVARTVARMSSPIPARLAPLPPEALDAAQRALYDAIAHGPRAQGPQHFPLLDETGALRGPFNAMLLSPALGAALQDVGAALRFGGSLPPRARELAILVVAQHWDSDFERESHEAVGRAVGLSEDELAAVRNADADAFTGDERLVVQVAAQLAAGDLDDALWAEASDALGESTIYDLTVLVGYYATLALQLRIFRVGD